MHCLRRAVRHALLIFCVDFHKRYPDIHMSFFPWIVMVIVFAIIFVVVILKAWQSGVMYGRKEVKTSQKKSKRSVFTQSQTTYRRNWRTPRFHVLDENSQGAW